MYYINTAPPHAHSIVYEYSHDLRGDHEKTDPMIFGHFGISNAYAYLDPGTGSIIVQMLIGTLVGAGVAIKVYWQKIKMRFTK